MSLVCFSYKVAVFYLCSLPSNLFFFHFLLLSSPSPPNRTAVLLVFSSSQMSLQISPPAVFIPFFSGCFYNILIKYHCNNNNNKLSPFLFKAETLVLGRFCPQALQPLLFCSSKCHCFYHLSYLPFHQTLDLHYIPASVSSYRLFCCFTFSL